MAHRGRPRGACCRERCTSSVSGGLREQRIAYLVQSLAVVQLFEFTHHVEMITVNRSGEGRAAGQGTLSSTDVGSSICCRTSTLPRCAWSGRTDS